MAEAASYILLTVLGCCAFLCAPYLFDLACSALDFLWRWTCWLLHGPLCGVRRVLKWINGEKVSMFTLAGSLILVTVLTVLVPRDPSVANQFGTDTGIYEGLRVAFAIFEGDSAVFRAHMTTSSLADRGDCWAVVLDACACLLPILVPLSTLTTAATLLWNHLPHHVPVFSRNWYIFSGLDPNSIRMARSISEDLKKTKDTGVFIFLRTRRGEQTPEILDDIRKLNYHLYPKTEDRFLRWPLRRFRRMRFFFLSENTDENFERMQDLLKAAKARRLFWPMGRTKGDVFQQELYLLSETESAPMLIGHLRDMLKTSGCFRNTELRLLDRFRATSYDLLRNVPLYDHIDKDSGGDRLNVLILGFGRIGREVFRAACSLGTIHGCKTEFTICDQQIGSKLNMFLSQCPELRSSVAIHPRKLNLDTDALDRLIGGTDYHYIVVALGDDERNIRVASRLKRFYRLRHWNHMADSKVKDIQTQICVNIEDSIKHTYTEGLWDTDQKWDQPLYVFGGLDRVFTGEVLMPWKLWTAARYIHRVLNTKKGEPVDTSRPLAWGEYERRSSVASAVRAEYLAGAFPPNASPEALADTEHRRWMAYVRSEGMRFADLKLVNVYYDEVGRHHVDKLGKLTPCLVDAKAELENVWAHLNRKDQDAYQNKFSFRERDEYLVRNAATIARIAETGQLPDQKRSNA